MSITDYAAFGAVMFLFMTALYLQYRSNVETLDTLRKELEMHKDTAQKLNDCVGECSSLRRRVNDLEAKDETKPPRVIT